MRIAYEKQIAGLQAIIQIFGFFAIAMIVIILFLISKTSAPRVSYVIDRLNIFRSWVNMSTRIDSESDPNFYYIILLFFIALLFVFFYYNAWLVRWQIKFHVKFNLSNKIRWLLIAEIVIQACWFLYFIQKWHSLLNGS